MAILMGDPAEPRDDHDEEIEQCHRCNSDDLTGGRATYETGVEAPDGYRETLTADYIECRSCGERWGI